MIAVEPVTKDAAGKDYPADTYGLRQIPEISGAMVAMDPHTGRVLAMTGGWSFQISEFDRATQAHAPAGLGLQAVRLSDGAGERLHALRR